MHAEMVVTSLMATTVTTTTADAELSDVIQSMVDNRYSCIIVVDSDKPVGIITERDIVRLVGLFIAEKAPHSMPISELMSVPVATISETATLFEALVISTAQKIRHLPVVNGDGKLVGLVTQSDLAKAHFNIFEKQREIIEHSVNQRTQELLQTNEQLKSLSLIDSLTGLGNRHAMKVDLEHTHSQAMRYKRTYSVVLFDVDYFKLYNDHYGHLAGDNALRQIAEYLQSSIRTSDRLYRYGGEEILLIIPETTLHGTLILADRILNGLAERTIPHEKSSFGFLTLSCGVATQVEEDGYDTWEALVDLADRGLYASKNNGRNRATIIPPEDALTDSAARRHGNNP